MGGATRFLFLLAPSPLLHHRCPSLLRLSRRLPPSLSSLHHHQHQHRRHRRRHLSLSSPTPPSLPDPTTTRLLPIKSSRQLHTQPSVAFPNSPPQRFSHPWPEFQSLLDNLSAFGSFTRLNADDEYVEGANLPDDFLRAASACLAFARHWPRLLGMVSRRDVEVVVESGTPFLFKNGNDSVRRMKSFLGNDVLDSDGAYTVDLMRFLLTYASDVTALETNNLYNRELVKSSVRNLFGELAKLSFSTPESNLSGSVHNQFLDGYGRKPRPFRQNIEMKRGDWICQRCSFMNFARNVKCLECSEARPKRLLSGGEWECPQCDFFNYARNTVCLRCDCKRPGEVSLTTANSRSGPGYGYGGSANKDDIESRLAANEEKAQRWFSKVSQVDSTSDMSSAIADEDFPEIMPLRKGVNRFVVSTRKTPLERRLANAQYRRNLGSDGTPEGNDFQMEGVNKTLGVKVSQKLDDILGRSSAYSDQNARADSSPTIASSGSSQYGNPRESNSNYVPFVPLPADMFTKKPENPKVDEKTHADSENYQSVAPNTNEETGAVSRDSEYHNSRDNLQLSEKPVNQEEIKHREHEEPDKSERWFKRVAEIDGVTDLASAISDEDFPEIMPRRKGENRFVVNRKKDRSLTSPTYKRRMAMEQANNNNFVPFVPFPPDYFAKKDKQQLEGADLTTKAAGETSNALIPGKSEDARTPVPEMDGVQDMENQQLGSQSWNSKPTGENLDGSETAVAYGTSNNENSTQKIVNPLPVGNNNLSSGYSGKETTNFAGSSSQRTENQGSRYSEKETTNLAGSSYQQAENQGSGYSGKEGKNLCASSSQPAENQNIRSSWSGKSLEGSAVKEPDPLDMSEEAKAERWFRRVAQIKDISELSQIPDEDFPSIMPMRKGVNRFVVSKRKTPLERRLTSQQYRRNLPIVSSDPVKKENDNS